MSPSSSPLQESSLEIVFSTFQRSEAFSQALFTGFSSLRVLTYTASIPMVVHMLSQFETVECIFGYEGVLYQFGRDYYYGPGATRKLSPDVLPSLLAQALLDANEDIIKKLALILEATYQCES